MKIILSDYFLKKGLYIDNHDNIILTITKIEISSDLTYAKVYLTTINSSVDQDLLIKHLNSNAKTYKFIIGKEVRIKKIPNLKFHYDKMFRSDLVVG